MVYPPTDGHPSGTNRVWRSVTICWSRPTRYHNQTANRRFRAATVRRRLSLNFRSRNEHFGPYFFEGRGDFYGVLSQLPRAPLADASVATGDGFGAGCGSLSPISSVADLCRANRDAAVDKFSVFISSFLLDVKMGSWKRPLQDAPRWGLTDLLLQGVL